MALTNLANNNNNSNNNSNNNTGGNNNLNSLNPIMMTDTEIDITDILENMNEKLNNDVMYREAVEIQAMAVLISKDKPNVLFTGPPGAGKTAIVEHIAYMIETNNALVPPQLQGKTIYNLQLSDIVCGTKFSGALEEKMKAVRTFFEDESNNAILFIDEIHQLISSKSSYEEIAQILKPALSRGKMKVIGATTTQEALSIEKDPALNRRFTNILVDELTKEQTKEILLKSVASFSRHYNETFTLTDKMCDLIVNLADEFTTSGSHRPDNALTLLDNTLANAVMDKRQMLISPDAGIRACGAMTGITLSPTAIEITAKKLASGNSIPIDFTDDNFDENFAVVQGQDSVLKELKRIMKLHLLNLHPRTKPLSFMFLGPSGTGKTLIGKILAQVYLNNKPIILNCAEFTSSAALNRILGSPPGYIGYSDKNELIFDPLISNPYQVIILDELEKGCKELHRLLMAALDEGQIKTNSGKIIDCKKAIFIATSNAGQTNERKTSIGFNNTIPVETDIKDINIDILKQYFDLEFLNRWENKYVFNAISEDSFKQIAKDTYQKEIERIKSIKPSLNINDLTNEELDDFVKANYKPEFGARPIKSAMNTLIDEKILSTN